MGKTDLGGWKDGLRSSAYQTFVDQWRDGLSSAATTAGATSAIAAIAAATGFDRLPSAKSLACCMSMGSPARNPPRPAIGAPAPRTSLAARGRFDPSSP